MHDVLKSLLHDDENFQIEIRIATSASLCLLKKPSMQYYTFNIKPKVNITLKSTISPHLICKM